ncbi:MAG: hypothetical protein F6J90_04695 [Moorea sp. SIOASIH]|uniref:hypothetical protein n=1 Tax=Moorena sp. SIOASIH TaxID=2607817 RepID=UPI0013B6AAE6|nr:hypothetical protein [Moorena sp. SIOASIH]NEO35654.1 hypothetical protein [Moorena sp. SIOASIH]
MPIPQILITGKMPIPPRCPFQLIKNNKIIPTSLLPTPYSLLPTPYSRKKPQSRVLGRPKVVI